MMQLVARLFTRGEPVLSEAGPRDARAMAALHGAAFHRGWSDDEFERLLFDRNIVAHRAVLWRSLVGFIVSRLVLDPAALTRVEGAIEVPGADAALQTKWTRATYRPAGSIDGRASGTWVGGKDITRLGRVSPPSFCGATWCDFPS